MSLLEHCIAACPYCGELLELSIEPGHDGQSYTEDCQVCCQPMRVQLRLDGGEVQVVLEREDGAG